MNVIPEIQKLGFDPLEYVVIGGAAMAARGLKETSDIDVLVSAELFEACKNTKEWKHHQREIEGEDAGLVNKEGTVELYPTICGLSSAFDSIREGAEFIVGIPFASMQDVLRIKQTYNREKDQDDITLIRNYIIDRL